MMSILSDLVEETIKVFMDGFFLWWANPLMNNLAEVLKRCYNCNFLC